MAEQQCEHCGKINPDSETYCYACGHILPAGERAVQTRGLATNADITPQLRWGTAYFGDDTLLRMKVRDTNATIEAAFSGSCILGRTADGAGPAPDVDLTEHRAEELGVSRHHVRLRRETSTVMIEDLGSRNGTFLNGARMIPYQPRVLRNGDELRLGLLVLRVAFARVSSSG